uniref:glycerol-3-phosphate dehydrogenase n=3 Tax=Lygus hesperus TaxID=30085 RepID=A0A0A9YNM9_LYGHE
MCTGVVGAGVCLEATKRGFKVALIDRYDFAAGTSSNSTKLIHGGVRYLEQAIYTLDLPMLKLVAEALRERGHMIRSASYMNHPLPIIIPIYSWWELPYMWIGCKLYDLIALTDGSVPSSYYISPNDIRSKFPTLRCDNVVGGIVYFDGQMNDARHTLTLLLTAQEAGATVVNYVNVDAFVKSQTDTQFLRKDLPSSATVSVSPIQDRWICGVGVTDTLSGERWNIRTKVVINATGTHADAVRKLDDPNAMDLVIPSGGVHLALNPTQFPTDIGLLIPKTTDKRVLFCLPWENGVVAGTTDSVYGIEDHPRARPEDVQLILDNLNRYLRTPITDDDILSVWCGVRPLVRNPKYAHQTTAKVSRDHMIVTSNSGLITVLGGKYTTYRLMAQQTVDTLLQLYTPSYFSHTNL